MSCMKKTFVFKAMRSENSTELALEDLHGKQAESGADQNDWIFVAKIFDRVAFVGFLIYFIVWKCLFFC